jgi:tetratricopeptide (TPR) repeat protein
MLQAQTYLGMKENLKAAEDLEAVHLLGRSSLESLHTLGDIYVTEDLPDLAQRAYQRVIDLDPGQPVARVMLAAERLAARGATTQASAVAEHYKKAAWEGLAEKDRSAVLKLQVRLGMARGETTPETLAVLEEIVKLDPLDGEALCLLGQHYAKQNEPDRAIFFYERAASVESFEAKAKVYHAQVLVSMGRYADAMPLLRRAQEVKPREDVARYLESVERVAKTKR